MSDRPYYIEGAVPTVALEDASGAVLGPVVRADREARWDLPDGEYEVVAGLRVCSGSCGELGPRVDDGCRRTVRVTGDVGLSVVLRPGRRCSVRD